MNPMVPVYGRIILRYVSGMLFAAGYISKEFADVVSVDPDLILLAGGAALSIAEGFYVLAKKYKWKT